MEDEDIAVLRLTLEVTYRLNGTDDSDQEEALRELVDHAESMDLLADGGADVVDWSVDVESI